MIIIHEGVPGSGKSYDSIRKIIDALKTGRIVYTNIDGIESDDCREAIAALTGLTRDALQTRLLHLEQGQITQFWSFVEPGAFVVIDEAQLFSIRGIGPSLKIGLSAIGLPHIGIMAMICC